MRKKIDDILREDLKIIKAVTQEIINKIKIVFTATLKSM